MFRNYYGRLVDWNFLKIGENGKFWSSCYRVKDKNWEIANYLWDFEGWIFLVVRCEFL